MKVNHARLDRLQARLQQQADREMERIIRSMTEEELLATIAELDADIDREERTIRIRARSDAAREGREAL